MVFSITSGSSCPVRPYALITSSLVVGIPSILETIPVARTTKSALTVISSPNKVFSTSIFKVLSGFSVTPTTSPFVRKIPTSFWAFL